ncbi:linear amide C-N hydrolase [Qipengyuania sp. 6B39]|nr:linear amide C-N hydrolase [Qipengyuania proteolytica]
MAKIPEKVIANVVTITKVFELLLQTSATVHRARRMLVFGRCLDFAESKNITIIIGPKTYQVSSRKTGATLALITRIRPREFAIAMIGQIRLGNGFADTPIFNFVGLCEYVPQAILSEFRLGEPA